MEGGDVRHSQDTSLECYEYRYTEFQFVVYKHFPSLQGARKTITGRHTFLSNKISILWSYPISGGQIEGALPITQHNTAHSTQVGKSGVGYFRAHSHLLMNSMSRLTGSREGSWLELH